MKVKILMPFHYRDEGVNKKAEKNKVIELPIEYKVMIKYGYCVEYNESEIKEKIFDSKNIKNKAITPKKNKGVVEDVDPTE